MNLKRLRFVNEFLTEAMNHWLFFPLALCLSGIPSLSVATGQISRFFLFWNLCGLLPLTFFVLRTKLKSLSAQLLFQGLAAVPICAAASSLFASNLYLEELERLLAVITAILYLGFSLFLNLKFRMPYTKALPLPAGIVIAGLCAARMGRVEWFYCCLFPLILCIGLFFITTYIQRYIEFLSINKSSAGTLPAGDMLHSGLGLAAGYTAFTIALLLLLSSGSWLERFRDFLAEGLQNLMRWFREWLRERLQGLQDAGAADMDIPAGGETGFFSRLLQNLKQNETAYIWRILEYVMVYVLIISLFFVLVRLFLRLLRCFQKFSLLRIRNFTAEDEDVFDVREKCDESVKTRKPQRRPGPLSYSDRIRRLYRRKVLSAAGRMTARDSGRLGLYTAREWESRLSVPGMADIYERARYTDREMTAEDLEKMKKVTE